MMSGSENSSYISGLVNVPLPLSALHDFVCAMAMRGMAAAVSINSSFFIMNSFEMYCIVQR